MPHTSDQTFSVLINILERKSLDDWFSIIEKCTSLNDIVGVAECYSTLISHTNNFTGEQLAAIFYRLSARLAFLGYDPDFAV